MKRFGISLILVILTVCLLAACKDGGGSPAENSAVFSKMGSIRVTSVEPFDEDLYSKKELKNMIDTTVARVGEADVSVESLEVKDNICTLVMEYASSDAFGSFNEGVPFFYGTCSDAVARGFDLSPLYGQPSMVRSSRIMTAGKVQEFADHMLIYVTSPQTLYLPGKAVYATANVRLDDKDNKAVLADSVSVSEPAILILQ